MQPPRVLTHRVPSIGFTPMSAGTPHRVHPVPCAPPTNKNKLALRRTITRRTEIVLPNSEQEQCLKVCASLPPHSVFCLQRGRLMKRVISLSNFIVAGSGFPHEYRNGARAPMELLRADTPFTSVPLRDDFDAVTQRWSRTTRVTTIEPTATGLFTQLEAATRATTPAVPNPRRRRNRETASDGRVEIPRRYGENGEERSLRRMRGKDRIRASDVDGCVSFLKIKSASGPHRNAVGRGRRHRQGKTTRSWNLRYWSKARSAPLPSRRGGSKRSTKQTATTISVFFM